MPKTVLLSADMNTSTGYGRLGVELAEALVDRGIDTYLRPESVTPPIPQSVADLLTKPLDESYTAFIHQMPPEQLTSKTEIDAKKIAWTMWEYNNFPDHISNTLEEQLLHYDELWVYDTLSEQVFAPYWGDAKPLRVIQGGFWSSRWKPLRIDHDGFRFCMLGRLTARKNPFAALNAFREVREKYPEAELWLKTATPGLHPALEQMYPGVRIFYDMWTPEKIRKFYASCDVFLAPSWGEGMNLPAVEAQAVGTPVIYSAIGGHLNWGSSQWGWPVDGETQNQDGLESFRVSHDSLVGAMLDAISNQTKTREKGVLASRTIPAIADWSKVAEKVDRYL